MTAIAVCAMAACGGKTQDPPAGTVVPSGDAGATAPDAAEAAPSQEAGACDLITFDDPAFEAQVRQQYAYPNGPIDPADAAAERVLAADSISSLRGIECFPALAGVTLSDCPSLDLAPLASLGALESLTLKSCGADGAPLVHLTKLQSLHVEGSQMSSVAFASNWPDLGVAVLTNTRVSDLRPLSNAVALRQIVLDGSPVTDVSPLGNLSNLTEIGLRDTAVTTIAALDHAPNVSAECADLFADGSPLDQESIATTIPHMCSLGWHVQWTIADGGTASCGPGCPLK